ncbi:D-amino-acid transaminase [Niallia taxi]|uniref:D-alanine aminotransferase n=1 Tax=Niallia taxi TaxID=2499688 RepID=A0A437KCT0_9BACI|nr:D-amino-acid transaminase [Niallia taxi]MCM3215029.1 D-amino-acid transaminase [Niallia taxi]MDK8639328.1 D-amino-acid transaminase [Niallia taxi]MED4036508.1 D-amino-acid transaminase [Niallia taxi]MED4052992.1 D-amino-acid transaminase [Niallia taxi]MED4118132.1 D-amino-acid transaminase [Niallia taxi]
MSIVWMNGAFIDRSEAKVDIEDRGYQFGDGIYEVIRVYNGQLFTANEHLERLLGSGDKLSIQIGYSVEEFKGLLEQLIEKNNLETGIVYMQVTRGVNSRNHAFPAEDTPPTYIAYTKEVARPTEQLDNGVTAITVEDIRWSRCDIKSLNLLGNVIAKQKATEADCYESIQYRDLTVTEGSSSNIWIIKDNAVKTHEANQFILNGITRQKIIELCQGNDIEVVEAAFTIEDLIDADEVFLSSTTAEVMPIISINNVPVGSGEIGPVARKLQQLFQDAIERECNQLA